MFFTLTQAPEHLEGDDLIACLGPCWTENPGSRVSRQRCVGNMLIHVHTYTKWFGGFTQLILASRSAQKTIHIYIYMQMGFAA